MQPDSLYASAIENNSQWFTSPAGLVLPKNLKESSSRAVAVAPSLVANRMNLTAYVRMQLQQSRRSYFVYEQMYEVDTWVRACIDYISNRATRDPNRLVDPDPDNPNLTDLRDFLGLCNPDYDFEDIYYGWCQDLLKYNQAYAYIERKRGGGVKYIWPLDSRITYPIVDFHGTIMFHVQAYAGHYEIYKPEEILYYRRFNNGSDPKSMPLMRTLVDSVAMELNANSYNAALFENNLNIGAIFTLGALATDEEVSDNDRYLLDKYSKPENAHRHLILRGDAKLLRDGVQAIKDIHFEEMIRLARHRVCSVFGVPESLIGIPDNTNRATGQVHERSTYVNTVRPLRKLINRTFTREFIRKVWGSRTITLQEPLSSMLPTQEEIDTAAKIAEIGGTFNELREMINMPTVANGDYYLFKNPANGGYSRADLSVMPGLGDLHWDPTAYQQQHDAQQSQQSQQGSDMALAGIQGMQPAPEAFPYVPVRPQDMIQQEPIAARIVDVSRSLSAGERKSIPDADFAGSGRRFPVHDEHHYHLALEMLSHVKDQKERASIHARIEAIARRKGFAKPVSRTDDEAVELVDWDEAYEDEGRYEVARALGLGLEPNPDLDGYLIETWDPQYVVSRRVPMVAGARGGNFYNTRTGKVRYGNPPQGLRPGKDPAQKSPDAGGEPPANDLQSVRAPNAPQGLDPAVLQQMSQARTEVSVTLRSAQAQNWDNDKFWSKLEKQGWVKPSEADSSLPNSSIARQQARLLSEQNPEQSYVIVGADGAYQVMTKALSEFASKDSAQPDLTKGASQLTPEGARHTREEQQRQGEGRPAAVGERRVQGEGKGTGGREAFHQGEGKAYGKREATSQGESKSAAFKESKKQSEAPLPQRKVKRSLREARPANHKSSAPTSLPLALSAFAAQVAQL